MSHPLHAGDEQLAMDAMSVTEFMVRRKWDSIRATKALTIALVNFILNIEVTTTPAPEVGAGIK